MHWPKNVGCLVGNRARFKSHCAKLWKLRKMAVTCGKRLCQPLPTFPLEMCKTIFDSLSENHMWLLISNYLCMEVNAVMRCPNVVNAAMLTKQALGWGRVLRSGGRVLRDSRGPSSPWGRVLRGVDFSMGPSFGLGRVLRGAEFSGILSRVGKSVNHSLHVRNGNVNDYG